MKLKFMDRRRYSNQARKYYVGQGHFSWWNSNIPTPPAVISGFVYGPNGNPIANANIYNNNILGVTDQTAFYSGISADSLQLFMQLFMVLVLNYWEFLR
jgi:hypothetical protein